MILIMLEHSECFCLLAMDYMFLLGASSLNIKGQAAFKMLAISELWLVASVVYSIKHDL